jgi:hypothetical protein
MNQIAPGVLCEWLYDQQIVAYTLTSAKLAALSAWGEMAIDNLAHWPAYRPYLALHDLSYPGTGLVYSTAVEHDVFNICVTPGRRQEIQHLLIARPQWTLALALIISPSLSGAILKLRVSKSGQQHERIQTKSFFDRSSALNWLTTFIQRHGSN